MDYVLYYASIKKPFFAPPEWVFGLAWGIIYPLLAIAGIVIIYLFFKKQISFYMVGLFFINLLANLAFTPIQLELQNVALASLDILIVLGTLVYFEYLIYRKSKAVFILLLPYLFWGAFATALQISIWIIN